MVHRRQIGDQEIVFGNQGALFGNAMTWWDHDTGSIWSQPLGEAIGGPRTGQTLELLPSTLTTWDAWRKAHPGTLALNAPNWRDGVDLEDTVIVVQFGSDAAAYPVADLRGAGVANDVVGGLEIAVVIDPGDPDRWAVFSRVLDAETVVLEIREGTLLDAGTGTEWDPVRGIGRDGPLQGEVLGLLPGVPVFERDLNTFWPHARTWAPPAPP